MSGISLPAIRTGGAFSYQAPNGGFESRPSSGNSDAGSTASTFLPKLYYGSDACVFQNRRSINTPRSFNKLPSIAGSRRASRSQADIHAKYSAKYRNTPDLRTRLSASSPFLPKSSSEDCLKCLLKIPHKKCESHKYIRVGGGYRHGYWYVKCLLEELELQRQRELVMKQRLEAIKEKQVKAIKTYIRTKSGRLIERIIFLSEEDYEAFKAGKGADILKKYLSKEEAEGLESWDKDEVKAIKTYVRTKSGRLIEKLVYVSKEDYDAITQGKVDAKELLKKYIKTGEGETIEGWEEQKMKTIKTYVRTKSGRLIEKTIMISQEDYDKMIKEGIDPAEILKKYLPLEEGETVEGWESQEPMKAVKIKVRTKSGRIIEKTIMVRADEYDRLMAGGADANEILGQYLGEEGGTIEGWEKAEGKPMKVIKTYVRTKSGRLIEKQILLTEEEYRAFQEAGGDPEFLKKFLKLEKGEVIEDWEKASTVYEDDDPELIMGKPGQRIVGKDGAIYEIVEDPLTGKKYKKRIGMQESDVDSGIDSMQKGKKGKKGKGGLNGVEEETAEERMRRKVGKRDADSDSDYSYKSFVSAGGTRHVQRRRKRADGTYSDAESYHSSQDADGEARRRRRRREREHQNSAHSYYSVVSEGGTRHVKRKRKRADGTYSDSESYHSDDSHKPGGRLAEKKRKEKEAKEKAAKEATAGKKKKKRGGSGSDYSYESEISEGGTRHVKRKKKIRDAQGNVVGYGDSESFSESDDESVYTEVSDGKGGKVMVKKPKLTSKQKTEAKIKAKAAAKAKEQIGQIKGGKFKDVGDFSDSTISDDVDLENMTEEEKAAYFKAKAERKAAREAKRREKYGDKYDLMVEKQKELKKLKKLQEMREKGMISPSSDWSIDSDTGEPVRKSVKKEAKKQKILQDLREKGLISPSSDWTVDSEGNPVRISELVAQGKRKPGKKGKRDGNEADDESDESEYDPITGEKIKKKKKATRPGDEGPDDYEYEYDDQGRVIKKKKKGGIGDDSGSEYEYEYDDDGNVRVVKKQKSAKKFGGEEDDAQFEVGADGKIRIRDGKKKIDLSKLTDDDLRKLGIDPTLDKKEIARLLKEKFGPDVAITLGDRIIPTRRFSDFGSDANTDDLADAEDLDLSTLRGVKKVNVFWKREGKKLMDHMKRILDESKLKDDYAKDLDEKDSDIDFLTHYKLVDPGKLESYARAFVVEDDDLDTVIGSKETKQALEGVPSVKAMTSKQLEYVFKVLKIDDASQVTFRMFAVISALCERVRGMDPLSKHLLEISDLLDIQRKMELYRSIFYCNAESDRNANFIKAESLRIELIAGGLNWKQQEFIMERLQPNAFLEISFLDYLCYVPLFLSMHENIVHNPLDMADDKYDHMLRRPSGGHRQRDMNPVGYPLRKESVFQLRKQAQDLLEGKIDPNDLKDDKKKLLEKVATKKTLKQIGRKASTVANAKNAIKAKAKAKMKAMSKEEREKYKKGKRNPDSDSEYSYRSVVSAGGTRHVMRRRKREDGTYSAELSYHSSQDEDGEARRRRRRRDRMHGSDSDHSYYSTVSAGGTRHVRRRRRRDDGTYSASEEYKSPAVSDDDNLNRDQTGVSLTGSGKIRDKRRGSRPGSSSTDDSDDESDVSYASEVSAGGTRHIVQRKRIRDADGNIVGYGDAKPVKPGKLSNYPGIDSDRELKDNLDALKNQRDGKLLREPTTDSLSGLRQDAEDILEGDKGWPGSDVAGQEQRILDEEEAKIPSDFSDATTEDDVDLSKLTPAQRRQYFADKEKRRQERERKRREKYGDKYDEIMRKKQEKKNAELAAKHAAREAELGVKHGEDGKLKVPGDERRMSFARRRSSAASSKSKGGRPKSMVTYDKGPPRDMGYGSKEDNREIGLSHDDWAGKRDLDGNKRSRRGSDDSDLPPKLHRETTMLKPLPTIPQGRMYDGDDDKVSSKTSKTGKSIRILSEDESDLDLPSRKDKEEEDKNKKTENYFELGADGKLRLKKKQIDLNKLTADDLRALGIDPNASAKEIAKKLKEMFGNELEITQGGKVIGTKGIDEYGSDVDEDELADDPDLDVDTLQGLKRVNIIMRKGGAALQRHLEKVLNLSKLVDKYAKDLDERNADIDFLSHYHLVDQSRLESYARAFVVEDADLDTVLNRNEVRVALDGVASVQHMTSKQMDYVMRVLKIDEATLITFRMFAVVTALCERVTHMDSLSQRLLEICNLADIERKLDLYKAMFYTNVSSDRDANFITSESLKIELIAGGLNWTQQQYILEKMEPNEWGDISFLDYMCYIPLFLSMHDNICYNPLDMSNQKYQNPPRTRPVSVQRDMNPLGCNLTKSSAYWARKRAMDGMMKQPTNAVQVSKSYMDILNKYTSEKYTKLMKVDDIRNIKREKTDNSDTSKSSDMIY